jgi:chaperonin GroES
MNNSGIRPVEYNCLVLPDEVQEKTAGGLILPETTKEKDEFGRMEGELVAVSPLAFTYGEWPDPSAMPKIGDRVMFARYQGTEVKGKDGRKYWLMKDKAIAGVME